MCSRFSLTSAPEAIRELFRYGTRPNFPPRADIYPSEPIGLVTGMAENRHFHLARWGFLPVWARDPAFRPLINARIETALEKPALKGAMRHGRCLIPADGFHEWSGGRGAKLKHLLVPDSGHPFAFAGLWGTWSAVDGSEIDGAAILTCAAAPDVAPLHDRMPVIVPPSLFDIWLDVAQVSGAEAVSKVLPAAPRGFTIIPPVPSGRGTGRAEQMELFGPRQG